MKILYFVKDDSYISRILLYTFLTTYKQHSHRILAFKSDKSNYLLLWLKYFIQRPGIHPDFYQKISRLSKVTFIDNANDQFTQDIIQHEKPDITFLLGFPQILNQNTISILGKVINYHNSVLPKYKGVFATHRAMLDNKKFSGFTFHLVEKEIDSGSIYYKEEVILDYSKNALTNDLIITEQAAKFVPNLINRIKSNTINKQEACNTFMNTKGFYSLLDSYASSEPTIKIKVILICGGLSLNIKGKALYITGLNQKGEITSIKGIPYFLYRLLTFFKLT
jgi:folate-dependent phosphoribosylglycinamide formyltransferase PurN